jgi:hypothetical protein
MIENLFKRFQCIFFSILLATQFVRLNSFFLNKSVSLKLSFTKEIIEITNFRRFERKNSNGLTSLI